VRLAVSIFKVVLPRVLAGGNAVTRTKDLWKTEIFKISH